MLISYLLTSQQFVYLLNTSSHITELKCVCQLNCCSERCSRKWTQPDSLTAQQFRGLASTPDSLPQILYFNHCLSGHKFKSQSRHEPLRSDIHTHNQNTQMCVLTVLQFKQLIRQISKVVMMDCSICRDAFPWMQLQQCGQNHSYTAYSEKGTS